jgi:hypothetical protein
MPRNADVMLICDELEKFMARSSAGSEQPPSKRQVVGSNPAASAKPKLSRAEIQRNYRLRKKAQRK